MKVDMAHMAIQIICIMEPVSDPNLLASETLAMGI